MEKLIFKYFIFINILSFLVFSFDKYRAKNNGHRIREKTLHLFSLLGGFVGAAVAMVLFRHKIKKSSFVVKEVLIIFGWLVLLGYYFFDLNELNFLRDSFLQ